MISFLVSVLTLQRQHEEDDALPSVLKESLIK